MEIKYGQVAHAILSALAIAGVIAVTITAPNLLQVFSSYGDFPRSRNWNIKRSLKTLEAKGLIRSSKKGVVITKLGNGELIKYKISKLVLDKKKIDDYVRLVLFDIPTNKNKNRKIFTQKLKNLGFRYLQKSVWIIDYDCEQEIKYLAKLLQIEAHIQIISARKF